MATRPRAPRPSPSIKYILLFTLAHLSLAAVWALMHGRHEFLVYLAFSPFLLAFIRWLHVRIKFSDGLLWSLSILALLHMAGGLLEAPPGSSVEEHNRLYDWWIVPEVLKFDHIVHTYGNAVVTWLCWQVLQRTVASKTGWKYRELRPTPELLFFCVLSGMGLGAANEIMEFVTTKFVPDHGVGGYGNTVMDLVSNTVGSLVAAFVIWAYGKKAARS